MKRFSGDRLEKLLGAFMLDDAAVEFSGTGWNATSLLGNSLLPQTTITLEFVDDSKAGGSCGCNNYSTTYAQIETTSALSFGESAVTRKGCVDQVMEQERAYLQALALVTGFQLKDQILSLTDADDVVLVEFSYVSQELAGTAWDISGYNNGKGGVVSVISGTSITAAFADGRVSGSSGCNSYSGSYESEGDAVSMGPLAGTRKMCIGEGVMEQEGMFLAALESAAKYRISGDTMEMRREDGALVVRLSRAE